MFLGTTEEESCETGSKVDFTPQAMILAGDVIDVTFVPVFSTGCVLKKVSSHISVRIKPNGIFRSPKVLGFIIHDVDSIREIGRQSGFPLRGVVSVKEVIRTIHGTNFKAAFGRYAKRINRTLSKHHVTVSL